MKKFYKMSAAVLLALAMTACSSDSTAKTNDAESEEQTEEIGTGVYTITNLTGESVKELYVYNDAADKGENYAENGMDTNAAVTVTKEDYPSDTSFTVEFVTESDYTAAFETLHIEEAPLYLLSEDLMSGATPISFMEPELTATYTVYTSTGETVKELYLYDTDSSDKGENLAGEGLEAGAFVELTKTVLATQTEEQEYTLEFVTESGYTGSFTTLHFEVAPIQLLAEDALTGATMISFSKPE